MMQNYSAGALPRENWAPQFEPVNLAPSAVFIAVELAMTLAWDVGLACRASVYWVGEQ